MFPLCHGKNLIMAQFHNSKPDTSSKSSMLPFPPQAAMLSAGEKRIPFPSIHDRFLPTFYSDILGIVLLLRHGQYFIVAQFDIAKPDKNTVGHGAFPHLRVSKRPETDIVKIRLHVQQQTAAGYEINLQDKSVQWFDC